jgi:hypothetical protein
MAEDPQDDEEDEEGDSEEGSYGWETDSEDENADEAEDYALRGLRFMTNLLENNRHDSYDVQDEDIHESRRNSELQESQATEQKERSDAAFITQGLTRAGVTSEMLVMCLLGGCHEEYIRSNVFDRVDRDVFGKIRTLIGTLGSPRRVVEIQQPAEANAEESVPQTPVASQPINPPPLRRERSVAEPKTPIIPVSLLTAFNECLSE